VTPSTSAKWVQLHLDNQDGDEVAADIYYICRHCGPARARLRWDDESKLISAIGETICEHMQMALAEIDFAS